MFISKAALSPSSPFSKSIDEACEVSCGCGGGLYAYSSNISEKIYAVPAMKFSASCCYPKSIG